MQQSPNHHSSHRKRYDTQSKYHHYSKTKQMYKLQSRALNIRAGEREKGRGKQNGKSRFLLGDCPPNSSNKDPFHCSALSVFECFRKSPQLSILFFGSFDRSFNLAAIGNPDFLRNSSRSTAKSLHRFDHLHSLNYFPKDNVGSI